MTMEDAGGLVIDEIEMHGFMRYVGGGQKVDLPPGFTVITGKTGAGKSTILDAITYALYGCSTRTDPPSNIKANTLFQPGGYVRVSFTQQGHLFEAKRGFNARGASFLELHQDGEALGGTIPEKDKMIENIVGLNYEGFRNSTFVRQEEMKDIGSEKGSKRLEVFQQLFRLQTFEKAQEAAMDAYREIEEEVGDKEKEIDIRRQRLGQLPEMEAELKDLEHGLSESRKQHEELKSSLERKRQGFKKLEESHEHFLQIATQAADADGRVSAVSKKLEKERKDAERSAELRRKVDALEKELAGYERLRDEEKALGELQTEHKRAQDQVDFAVRTKRNAEVEHDSRLKAISKRLFDTESRIAKLKTDVSQEEAFELLRGEGRLTERINRIEKELTWLAGREDVVSRLKDERVEAEAELLDVGGRVKKINIESFALSELKRQVAGAKEELRGEDETFKPRLAELESDVQAAMEAKGKVKFTDADKASLEDIRKAIERLKPKVSELEAVRTRMREAGDAAKLIAELEGQRSAAAAESLSLSKRMEDMKPQEQRYAEEKRAIEDLRAGVERAVKDLATSEEAVKRLGKQIKDLRTEEATISAAEASLKSLQDRREVFAILKDEVFHKRGVVMYAIDQLMPELEIEASKNLSELTDGRFNKVKLETYEESGRHGVRITVEGVDGKWHDIGEFSGGERTQINAALRFAIARELASMPQLGRSYGKMKTLFIDEGDLGSLDTEVSRDLFVRKLFTIGNSFDKVILITHLTEVAERFPSRMYVSMNERGESRVEVVR